jgi:hypothetical protein
MYNTCICQTLTELGFCRQIFEKSGNIIFRKNPSGGSPVVPRGHMARHDEANSRLRQFYERA